MRFHCILILKSAKQEGLWANCFPESPNWRPASRIYEDEPRADMVLPLWVLAFGLFSLVCGIASAVYAAATAETAMAVFALIFFIAAVLLTLAWRNQTARMLSDDEFEVTSIFGIKRRYSFSEISQLKRYPKPDTYALLIGKERFYIRPIFLFTERFIDRINRSLPEGDEIF